MTIDNSRADASYNKYGTQVNARVNSDLSLKFEEAWAEQKLKQGTAVEDALKLWLAYTGKRYDVLAGEVVTSDSKNGAAASVRVLTIKELLEELLSDSNSGRYIRMKLEPIEKNAASEEDNVSANLVKEIFERKPDAAFPLMQDDSVGNRKLGSMGDWAYGEQAKGEALSILAVWGSTGKSTVDLIEASRMGLIVSNNEVRAFRHY
ncbi:MAG: hypothetical protein ACRDF4_05255 [Rhabdochlamydiaceae bacterium]